MTTRSLLATLSVVALATPLAAQPIPHGPEFQVNAYTTGDQVRPALAVDAGGTFTVVWRTLPDDTTSQGRRLDNQDAPATDEFQLDMARARDVVLPADGSVQVVGDGFDDGSLSGIGLRSFDADGLPTTDETAVNTYTTGVQSLPRAARTVGGGFVVVWSSDGSPDDDSDGYGIRARRYLSDGQAAGGTFQVNSYTTGEQRYPSVEGTPDGGFVVVFAQGGEGLPDTTGIRLRRFDATDTPVGDDFTVNTYTTGSQIAPAVSVDAENRALVSWSQLTPLERRRRRGAAPIEVSIRSQLLSAAGAPIGDELDLGVAPLSSEPSVANPIVSIFVVAWEDDDGAGSDVVGQLVSGDSGAALEQRFVVNSYTTGGQAAPRVLEGRQGELVVTWMSQGSLDDDFDGWSVQARRFGVGIFGSGFESGGVDGWDEVFPPDD